MRIRSSAATVSCALTRSPTQHEALSWGSLAQEPCGLPHTGLFVVRQRGFFMSRVAQVLKSKVTIAIVAVVVIATGVGIGIDVHNHDNGHVQTVTNAQHKITQISYNGQNGVNAYVLLQKHATVQAKHYSFGYLVTSIDGVVGNGPKYWTFYVNDKQASVGASSYVTKNSDRITWKLQ